MLGAHQGADDCARSEPVTHTELRREASEPLKDLVVHPLLNVQPCTGDALLAHVREHTKGRTDHSHVQVGVVKDDVRTLPPELECEALEVLECRGGDSPPRGGRTSE